VEINITEYFMNGNHWMNSNSVANLGYNAATTTWNCAKEESLGFFFITDDNKEEIKEYFKGFGAWEREEIGAWSDIELNALLLQLISGDINELEYYDTGEGETDWQAVEAAQGAGQISSNLTRTDNNEFYYYIC
jgi:hypothetical protein